MSEFRPGSLRERVHNLLAEGQPLTASGVARKLGIPREQASTCLNKLQAIGVVVSARKVANVEVAYTLIQFSDRLADLRPQREAPKRPVVRLPDHPLQWWEVLA